VTEVGRKAGGKTSASSFISNKDKRTKKRILIFLKKAFYAEWKKKKKAQGGDAQAKEAQTRQPPQKEVTPALLFLFERTLQNLRSLTSRTQNPVIIFF
jgi:hypothetical protein